MLKLGKEVEIQVYRESIDFRKGVDSLLVFLGDLGGRLSDGTVYVFYNRNKSTVRCLYWERNGFVLHQKRLERGRFKIGSGGVIGSHQLEWLLAGLDYQLMSEFPEMDFTCFN